MNLVDEIYAVTAVANGEEIVSTEVCGDESRTLMRGDLVDALWAHDPDEVGREFDTLFDALERIPGAPASVEGEVGEAQVTLTRTIG